MTSTWKCNYCGRENESSLKHCPGCGTASAADAGISAVSSRVASAIDGAKYRGRIVLWEAAKERQAGFRRYDSVGTLDNTGTGQLVITGDAIILSHRRAPIKVLCMVLSFPVWGLSGMALGEWVFKLFGESVLTVGWMQVLCMVLLGWGTWLLLGFPFKGLRRRIPLSSIFNAHRHYVTGGTPGSPADGRGVSLGILPLSWAHSAAQLPSVRAEECSYLSFIAASPEAAAILMLKFPSAVCALTGRLNPQIPPQQSMPWQKATGSEKAREDETHRPWELDCAVGKKTYAHDHSRWTAWKPALGALLFGLAVGLVLSNGLIADRGVVINGIIRLGPGGHTVMNFIGFAVMVCLFLANLGACLQRWFNPHFIELESDAITFVEGFVKPLPRRLPLAEVEGLSESQPVGGGSRTLFIRVRGHNSEVSEALLSGAKDYEEIKIVLNQGAVVPRRS